MAEVSFGSNLASLRALRRIGESTADVGRSFTRLASGMRINSASDDAAGLAVADSLRNQSRLYTTAVRNINDGLSLISVAASALSNQSNIVQRMLELTEQSASGSISNTQRRSLGKEYSQLLQEFARLANSTSFNGLKPLLAASRGGLAALSIQAGINGSGQSILSLTGTDSGSFSGTINVRDLKFHATPTTQFNSTQELAAYFGNFFADIGNGQYIGISEEGSAGHYNAQIFLRNPTAGNPDAMIEVDTTFGLVFDANGHLDSGSIDYYKTIYGLDLSQLVFSDTQGQYMANRGATTALDFSTTLEQNAAKLSIDVLKNRIESLASQQGVFGAFQSRLSQALNLTSSARENVAAAESRIRDVDVAEESANLISAKIRQQSSALVLKNANMQPQLLLSLLN